MSNDFVRREYNKIAETYLKGRDKFKNNKYLDRLMEMLPPGSTVLDIGCGAGIPIDSYLIDHGHRVIGIDISEKQIELAKKSVPEGKYSVKDMSMLRRGEYEVDAVVSFYTIFHTPRETHLDLLKKMGTFLKPHGLILITMGSSDWEGKENNFFGGEMEWSHYDSETNIKIVKEAGYEILTNEIDTTGDEKHLVIIARKN